MTDREGLDPADEKPATTEEEDEILEIESESEETPIQQDDQATETPTEEAPVPAVDEPEVEGDPLDIGFSDEDAPEEPPAEEEESAEDQVPDEEVDEVVEAEEEEEPEAIEPEQKPHLYQLPKDDWKKLSQQGRNEYLQVRKDAETLRAQAESIDKFTAQLGLDDQDVLTAMQLMSGLKSNPTATRDMLAEHFPEVVQVTPPAPPAPVLSKEIVDELGAALEDTDFDRMEAAFEKLKALAAEAEKPAPAPEPVKKEEPAVDPYAEDRRIWEALSAVSGIEEAAALEAHAKALGQRVVKRLGKVPSLAETERELLREHRLLVDEQRKAAEAAKPRAKPLRSRAPKAVPAKSVQTEPEDPLSLGWA